MGADSDNELYLTSENWPRFLLTKSASEERLLNKLSPVAVEKGFQAIAGTLKGVRRLRDGSFLVECNCRTQATNLLKTERFVDRPVQVTIHKTQDTIHLGEISDAKICQACPSWKSEVRSRIRVSPKFVE